ncbi:MAG: LrgB family protein [Duncaniella sp.]|nr:LrgB family protein [Bacteroides sp.]MDE6066555.1 LrgB family protein [Duncaniella sp.]
MDFIESDIFLVALTFGVYFAAIRLRDITRISALHPVLVTVAVLIVILRLTGISYETYSRPGRMIEFWLKPAIVALGLPLYTQLKAIRRQFVPILVCELAGCIVGIISVVLIAKCMGASREVIISLAPKSVTNAIAIEITGQLGGIPSLTASIVVLVGLLGAVAGLKVLSLGNIYSPVAQGISMGTAAHVIGTSRVTQLSERYGAYATVGLIINGVLTSILAGPLLDLMGI